MRTHPKAQRHRPHSDRRAQGFTLIEVLIALTLAGVVVTAAGRIAVQTLLCERSVSAKLAAAARIDHVFATLATDLSAAATEPIRLSLDANHRPTIEITCLAPHPSKGLRQPRLPSTVTYRLVRTPRGLHLRRALRDDTKPRAAPVVTTIAKGVTSFGLAVFDRGAWHPLDAALASRLDEPKALRLTCRVGTDEAQTRTFLIERSLGEKS